jgi:hypothetical protein
MIPRWRCSRQHQGGLPPGSCPMRERGWRFWKTAIDRGLAASGRHHVDMQKGA